MTLARKSGCPCEKGAFSAGHRFSTARSFFLSLVLSAACLLPAASVHAQTELGAEDDITVLGANGTLTDPDAEIKGFTVFGATQAAYTGALAGAGNVVVNGVLSVSTGAYFAGESTFTAAGKIFVNDGDAGQLLQKSAAGNLVWISSTSMGDNLGSHIATTTLQMGAYGVNTSSNITAALYQINGATMAAILPGTDNIAYGVNAGSSTAGGAAENVFIGNSAGASNTTGSAETFVGHMAGFSNRDSYGSVFVGSKAGYSQSNYAEYNTYVGYNAGYKGTGSQNTLIGGEAGYNTVKGEQNTFVGYDAGYANATGGDNTYIGQDAGYSNKGSANVTLGSLSGYGAVGANYSSSTIVGYNAGDNISSGSDNILIGFQAGYNITTGTGNIVIGYGKDTSATGANNELNIGGALYGKLDTGNIGIGTNAPAARLHVSGDTQFGDLYASTFSALGYLTFANLAANPAAAAKGRLYYNAVTNKLVISTASDAASWVNVVMGGTAIDGGGASGRLAKWVDPDSLTQSLLSETASAMTLVDSASMTVTGALGLSASRLLLTPGVEISSAPGSQYGGVYVSTHIYVSSNVYVGLNSLYVAGGSTSQLLKKNAAGFLQWADDEGGVSGTGSQYRLPMWNSDTVLTNSVINQDGGTNSVTVMGSTLTVQGNAFSVGGSTLAVKAGGVGIGTGNPQYMLDIYGPGTAGTVDMLRIVNTNVNGFSDIVFGNNSGTSVGALGYSNASAPLLPNTMVMDSGTGIDLAFATDNDFLGGLSERLRIKAGSGNIGMGTITPNSRLHLSSGTVTIDGNIARSVTATGDISAARYQINGATIAAILPATNSIAYGVNAGSSTVAGAAENVFVGNSAGASNTTGSAETFVGHMAGFSNRDSYGSVFVGSKAGYSQSNYAEYNTYVGYNAGYKGTGSQNTLIGGEAGYNTVKGEQNTFVGYDAGYANATGGDNTYIGQDAGYSNKGSANVTLGSLSGYGAVGANYSSSTIVGYNAGDNISSGSDNILIGFQAGYNITTGTGNIVIGYGKDTSATGANNELNIGGALYGKLDTGNIGIGTNAPAARLHVSGDTQFGDLYASTFSALGYITLANLDSAPAAAAKGRVYYNPTDNKLKLSTGTDSASWVDVVVGGTGVSGTGSNGRLAKWMTPSGLGDSAFSETAAAVTLTSDATMTITGSAFSVGQSTFVVKDGFVGIGTTTPQGLFQVGAGTLTVTAAGNVGVGLIDPTAKLHVQAYEAGKYTLYVSTSATAGQYSIAVDAAGVTNIKNLVIENRTSDPDSPVTGQIWLRTD